MGRGNNDGSTQPLDRGPLDADGNRLAIGSQVRLPRVLPGDDPVQGITLYDLEGSSWTAPIEVPDECRVMQLVDLFKQDWGYEATVENQWTSYVLPAHWLRRVGRSSADAQARAESEKVSVHTSGDISFHSEGHPEPRTGAYDALLQADEQEATLDCGCILRREFGDGSVSLTYCVHHAAISPDSGQPR